MGCCGSTDVREAAQPEPEAKGKSDPGRGSSAKDLLSSQSLPENSATGSTSTAITEPRARLQAYVDSHSVVIFSKSTCKRCTEDLTPWMVILPPSNREAWLDSNQQILTFFQVQLVLLRRRYFF